MGAIDVAFGFDRTFRVPDTALMNRLADGLRQVVLECGLSGIEVHERHLERPLDVGPPNWRWFSRIYNLATPAGYNAARGGADLIGGVGAPQLTVLLTKAGLLTAEGWASGAGLGTLSWAVLIRNTATSRTLAHELGHQMGWENTPGGSIHSGTSDNLMYRISGQGRPDEQYCELLKSWFTEPVEP